jgi:hypothetical protein
MIFSPHFLSRVASSDFVTKLEGGNITIDNSEYATWSSCFTMGLYNGALRRVGARSRSPLAFGGAVHAGLDAYFKGEAKWMDKALADAAVTHLDEMGDPKRNTDKLQSLLLSYTLEYERRKDLQFDILKVDGVPMVEKSFTVPLGTVTITDRSLKHFPNEITVLWSGRIDLLTKFDGAIAPADHKTTSVMGEKFADDKQRSSQMLGYSFAAKYLSEHLFGNLPVFGARINALATRSTGYEFKLFDLPFPDYKVAEWQREALLDIKRLITDLDYFMSSGEAVPRREHCVTKYGKCAYFDICDTHPSARDRVVFDDSYFYVSQWSPLNE